MKLPFMVLMLLASITNAYTQACCCTGAGANYSILPNLNKHVIGIHYTYKSYFSETKSLNPELDGMITNEQVNTLELFGRFNLNKRFQLSVFLPVSMIHERSKQSDNHVTGLGDMSFLFQYNVLDPLKCNGKKSKHQLRIGLGTKLPSGEFSKTADNLYTSSVQPGTGSIDFMANLIYTYRYNDFGFNTRIGYKLNTINKYTFKFGDKAEGAFNAFYLIKAKQVSFMPSLGLAYVHGLANRHNHQAVYLSQSDVVTGSLSFDIYFKHLAFSISALPVFYQHLSVRDFKERYSLESGLFYNF